MSRMVEHYRPHRLDMTPDWVVTDQGAAIRCYSEATATRVAQALDLLDDYEKPEVKTLARFMKTIPLPEDEILQRAREAAIAMDTTLDAARLRAGQFDNMWLVITAARALRDLSKPLAELVPKPVDPDLVEAKRILGVNQNSSFALDAVLTALKRGREMARESENKDRISADMLDPSGLGPHGRHVEI